MSKLDPPDPYLEGSHAKPKSNIAISPPQITKPANNDNDKTEKARTRQPSRPSTSSDGTMISVGSPQWCEPNCQVPDDENHLAWDDFQVVQKPKKKNNKKRKVDGPHLLIPTDESTAPTPSYELSFPMFAVVISPVQKNTSLKPLKFEPKKHIDFLRMNIFKKLRKEFDIFINRNGEAEVFANDAACLTSLLDLTHIGNMEVTCKPKEQLIQKETRLVIYNIPSLYTDNDIQEGLTDSSLLSYPLKSITRLKKRNENNELVASNSVLCAFEGEYSPEKLFLFGGRVAFRFYDEKPIQCKHCLKLGHTQKFCPFATAVVCKNCTSRGHSESNCHYPTKCINCGGSHLSDDRNVCAKYKQRSQIVKIAQEKRIPVPIIANAMRKEPSQPHINFVNTPSRRPTPVQELRRQPQQAWKKIPATNFYKTYSLSTSEQPISITSPSFPRLDHKVGRIPAGVSPSQPKRPTFLSIRGNGPQRSNIKPPTPTILVGNQLRNLTKFIITQELIRSSNYDTQMKNELCEKTLEKHFPESLLKEVTDEFKELIAIVAAINIQVPQ
ncbi:hypothetical protein QYM36_009847 [Artemia franciscana]|uniref:Gag-like protein n=1 Tax=Artemia franciscana TaxID=6661 RepID=A0AA88L6R3_ARTSF|nr:hypothetical protein QYM36_009847 [Artemia franciscana]